jgi:hypothetical protein
MDHVDMRVLLIGLRLVSSSFALTTDHGNLRDRLPDY